LTMLEHYAADFEPNEELPVQYTPVRTYPPVKRQHGTRCPHDIASGSCAWCDSRDDNDIPDAEQGRVTIPEKLSRTPFKSSVEWPRDAAWCTVSKASAIKLCRKAKIVDTDEALQQALLAVWQKQTEDAPLQYKVIRDAVYDFADYEQAEQRRLDDAVSYTHWRRIRPTQPVE